MEASTSSSQAKTEIKNEERVCFTCKEKFIAEVIVDYRYHPPKRFPPLECPKCQAARSAQIEQDLQQKQDRERQEVKSRWRHLCGMGPELLTKTFANFDRQYQEAAYKAALEWASGFNIDSPWGYRSLLFCSGVPGVGKGHLMAAIVNYLIDNWQGKLEGAQWRPIRFESGPSLVRRIRATYNIRPGDERHEREDEVYHSVAGVHLLLLDDVGKEKPSDFTRETYWYVIDERVKLGLPVIMSSRLEVEGRHHPLKELMGEDTVDRLYGMTRGQIIEMMGQSYRRRMAVP